MLPYLIPAQNYNLADDVTRLGVLALSDVDSDTEELIYNGKVYFDEEDRLDGQSRENSVSILEDNTITSVSNISIENTDGNLLLKDEVVENSEVVSSGEILEDEEEIVFYDNFDTGYWEELEEIRE